MGLMGFRSKQTPSEAPMPSKNMWAARTMLLQPCQLASLGAKAAAHGRHELLVAVSRVQRLEHQRPAEQRVQHRGAMAQPHGPYQIISVPKAAVRPLVGFRTTHAVTCKGQQNRVRGYSVAPCTNDVRCC